MAETKKKGKAKNSAKKRERVSSATQKKKGRATRVPLPDAVRKSPSQTRSKQMVQAILQAAAEAFAQNGYARTTTNKIAERAGVSVGSLYQYFPNKDSLLASLFDEHHREVHEVLDVALARLADPATDLEDGLRLLLTDLVAVHQANPDLTRALSTEVLRESPAAEAYHKERNDGEEERVVSKILAMRPDVRKGDHEVMATVLGQATGTLTRWLIHDAPPGADPSELQEEVVQLLVRYLRK